MGPVKDVRARKNGKGLRIFLIGLKKYLVFLVLIALDRPKPKREAELRVCVCEPCQFDVLSPKAYVSMMC